MLQNSNGPYLILSNFEDPSPKIYFEKKNIYDDYIVKISSGADHFALLSKRGRIYTMGCNEQNQLGRSVRCLRFRNEMKPHMICGSYENVWTTTYATFAKSIRNQHIYACGLNNSRQFGT